MKRCTFLLHQFAHTLRQEGGRPATKQANNKKTVGGSPIAVVVNLIRPNRGLAVVLLGKSTTTKKMGSQGLSSSVMLFI